MNNFTSSFAESFKPFFRVVESLHCNFHNVENSNCTFHIVENITKYFPYQCSINCLAGGLDMCVGGLMNRKIRLPQPKFNLNLRLPISFFFNMILQSWVHFQALRFVSCFISFVCQKNFRPLLSKVGG